MARTANVFARVEPEIKEQAEQILLQLDVPMSNAVGMFLRQVILKKGIPFEITMADNTQLSFGALSREQFDAEIAKGMADIKNGKVHSAEIVEAEMKRDYRI